MIDRAKIFNEILHRNAFRREAQLPSPVVQQTCKAEVEKKSWIGYYRLNTEPVKSVVNRELRTKHGASFPKSWGGHIAVTWITQKIPTRGLSRSAVYLIVSRWVSWQQSFVTIPRSILTPVV